MATARATKHRRFADGRSSYDGVIRAVNLLRRPEYREIYAGLLCTIDLRGRPGRPSYRALAALEPPAVDFLLPHATWDSPPPGTGDGRTPYADWIARGVRPWVADSPACPSSHVRVNNQRPLRGSASLTEAFGLEASDLVVVETDGTIEQADSIKVAYDGAPATDLDVFSHALDEAAAHPAIKARQRGIAGLSATCRACPVVISCGGGLYAHRYRSGAGFDNPSVYCADLEKIITYIRARVRPAATTSARRQPASSLPDDAFDGLAAGYGDRTAMTRLIEAERSNPRTLLRLLREGSDGRDSELFLAGWRMIVALDKTERSAVNEILGHPYVRAWAEQCLRDAAQANCGSQTQSTEAADMGHLAAIAAAAAIRARVTAEIDAPIRAGHIHLPTLGRLRVGSMETATVATESAGFEVRAASGKWRVDLSVLRTIPEWEPVRELHAGQLSVRLEDTDPYRDCHQWPLAPRLSEASVASWQEQFAIAWDLIERDYPGYASGIATGLSTIMPLANDVPGREISASARAAFGAVGAALPASGEVLALLLIHEFQHVKLGAMLDLHDLYEAIPGQRFNVLWRDDARPIEPVLQGAYAHIGVTDYWRIRRHRVGGEAGAEAVQQFARWRMATAEAIDTLASSGALTGLGERFVARMRATVEPWLDESVDGAAVESARRWAATRRGRQQSLR